MNKGGRTETRRITLATKPKWIENQNQWKDLHSVVMLARTRQIKGEVHNHKAFYIKSLVNPSPE